MGVILHGTNPNKITFLCAHDNTKNASTGDAIFNTGNDFKAKLPNKSHENAPRITGKVFYRDNKIKCITFPGKISLYTYMILIKIS